MKIQPTKTKSRCSVLSYSSRSCNLLRVRCTSQAQHTPEPDGPRAPGEAQSPAPGAEAHTPFLQTHRSQAPPPPGPADLHRPLGLEPRRPKPCALRSGPRGPAPAPQSAAGSAVHRRSSSGPCFLWVPWAQGKKAGRPGPGRSGGRGGEPAPTRPPRAGWRSHGGLHPVLSLRGE